MHWWRVVYVSGVFCVLVVGELMYALGILWFLRDDGNKVSASLRCFYDWMLIRCRTQQHRTECAYIQLPGPFRCLLRNAACIVFLSGW